MAEFHFGGADLLGIEIFVAAELVEEFEDGRRFERLSVQQFESQTLLGAAGPPTISTFSTSLRVNS
jgi:hypothetical protein